MEINKKCPICSIQIIDPRLLGLHLSYCRQRRAHSQSLWQCPFNTLHVVPLTERDHHWKSCPDHSPMIANFVERPNGIEQPQPIENNFHRCSIVTDRPSSKALSNRPLSHPVMYLYKPKSR